MVHEIARGAPSGAGGFGVQEVHVLHCLHLSGPSKDLVVTLAVSLHSVAIMCEMRVVGKSRTDLLIIVCGDQIEFFVNTFCHVTSSA